MFGRNLGNPEIKLGESHDSGAIYRDLAGNPRKVKVCYVATGALPNIATSNVAHGLSIDPEFASVSLLVNDGTVSKGYPEADLSINATNIIIVAAGNESAFSGIAIVHYIEPIA